MTVRMMFPFRLWRDILTTIAPRFNLITRRVKQSVIVLRMKLPQLQTMQKVEKLLPLQMIRKLEIRGV